MIQILLNSIALEPNRWTEKKIAHFSVEELLDPIAAAGFHFVELWQYHISRRSEHDIAEIRAIANPLGLKFPVIGMYPRLHLTGQEHRNEMNNIERLMNYACHLGAEVIKTFVGVHGSKRISDSDYQRTVGSLHEILGLADSLNLAVTAETHPNTLCDNLASSKKLIERFGSKNFSLCFQPFDFFDTDKAIDDYSVLSARVVHVHYQGQKNGSMALLSESDLDYTKLTAALVEHGFSGKICIEFVKDCVVKEPEDFDIEKVVTNAICDRDFIANILRSFETVKFVY